MRPCAVFQLHAQLSTQQRRVRQLQAENAAALSELETLRSTGIAGQRAILDYRNFRF